MSWTGRKLYYAYLHPNKYTSYEGDLDKNSLYSGDVTVGDDVEIGKNAALFQVDFYDKGLFIDFKSNAVWTNRVFNGPMFADKYGALERIAGFTLNTNIHGLNEEDIRLTHAYGASKQTTGEDALYIDLGGLATSRHSYIFITFKVELNTTFDRALNDRDNTVSGTALGDRMNGRAGRDILNGSGSDDVLVGGKGDDRLTGGAGDDTFVFDRFSSDTVTDFSDGKGGHDLLDFSRIAAIRDYRDLVDHHMTHKGDAVIIDVGNGEHATLLGVSIREIGRDDVLF
jgi:Ca2+-binding RTX toxin-like protein